MSAEAPRAVPVLRGARVTLRPPALGDAEAARRIGVDPEVMLGFGEVIDEWREATSAEAEELIAGLAPNPDKVEWVIALGDGLVGTARLHHIDEPRRTAAYVVGILSPDLLGKGYGTEITRLISAYAFDDLKLEALTVRILDFNRRAIACYARCGFVLDHREPRVLQLHGRWHDDVIMRLDAAHYRVLLPSWTAVGDYPGG